MRQGENINFQRRSGATTTTRGPHELQVKLAHDIWTLVWALMLGPLRVPIFSAAIAPVCGYIFVPQLLNFYMLSSQCNPAPVRGNGFQGSRVGRVDQKIRKCVAVL